MAIMVFFTTLKLHSTLTFNLQIMDYIIRVSVAGWLSLVRPWKIIQLELNLNIHEADSYCNIFYISIYI